MKKTLKLKLLTNPEQDTALLETMSTFNEICNWISEQAFAIKVFEKIQLHHKVYHDCRKRWDFSSQLIVRAISVVSDSYKKDRRSQRVFRKTSAVVYDSRVLSYKLDKTSIWTTSGRIKIPLAIWNQTLYGRQKGESDLILQDGKWYLLATVETPDIKPLSTTKFLGIDLGEVNIAVDSEGEVFTADKIEKKRQQLFKHRQRLQKRHTKSALRRIKKVGHRESRFRRDVNHCISKRLVQKAKGTAQGIALENLKGIRERTTVRKEQRAKRASWSFWQLRSFLEYKAMEAGVPVKVVNAKNTSRTCSACGHCSKRNRKSQSEFVCQQCGFVMNADRNAAKNIAFRAVVNQPIVSDRLVQAPRSLAEG